MALTSGDLWEALLQMVDEGKLSVIVEGSVDTIDGGEVVTSGGEVFDVVAQFALTTRS